MNYGILGFYFLVEIELNFTYDANGSKNNGTEKFNRLTIFLLCKTILGEWKKFFKNNGHKKLKKYFKLSETPFSPKTRDAYVYTGFKLGTSVSKANISIQELYNADSIVSNKNQRFYILRNSIFQKTFK